MKVLQCSVLQSSTNKSYLFFVDTNTWNTIKVKVSNEVVKYAHKNYPKITKEQLQEWQKYINTNRGLTERPNVSVC